MVTLSRVWIGGGDANGDGVGGMGKQAWKEGQIEEALGLYESAADLLLKEGESVRWAHTFRHCANLQLKLGQVEQARQSIEEVVLFYRSNGTGTLEMGNTLRIAALVEDAAVIKTRHARFGAKCWSCMKRWACGKGSMKCANDWLEERLS